MGERIFKEDYFISKLAPYIYHLYTPVTLTKEEQTKILEFVMALKKENNENEQER